MSTTFNCERQFTLTQSKVERGGDRRVGFIGSKEGKQNVLHGRAVPLQCLSPLHSTFAVTQIHSSLILDYRLHHQTSIFSSHSPTLMLSVSRLIDRHAQLTGPHCTASSSLYATSWVYPVRHFSAQACPLILIVNMLQHNTRRTWNNTKIYFMVFLCDNTGYFRCVASLQGPSLIWAWMLSGSFSFFNNNFDSLVCLLRHSTASSIIRLSGTEHAVMHMTCDILNNAWSTSCTLVEMLLWFDCSTCKWNKQLHHIKSSFYTTQDIMTTYTSIHPFRWHFCIVSNHMWL